MATESILDRKTSISLLRKPATDSPAEDVQHVWSNSRYHHRDDVPLLRLWDCYSGSQPDGENRMRARAPRQRLDTATIRKESLALHANYKNWAEPTPYISFTSSPHALEQLATKRSRRGPHTLTVINPNIRIAKGLPLLDMGLEMSYYGVPNPYPKWTNYFKYHYLCVWEVTPQEIVRHWPWDDLQNNENWYEEIVLPAFKAHNTPPSPEAKVQSVDLLDAMNRLSLNNRPPPYEPSVDSWWDGEETLSEEYDTHYNEDFFDSDSEDEAEEANRNDDLMKILEGDWK